MMVWRRGHFCCALQKNMLSDGIFQVIMGHLKRGLFQGSILAPLLFSSITGIPETRRKKIGYLGGWTIAAQSQHSEDIKSAKTDQT